MVDFYSKLVGKSTSSHGWVMGMEKKISVNFGESIFFGSVNALLMEKQKTLDQVEMENMFRFGVAKTL